MTIKEKTKIEELRREGLGYGSIARILGLSANTVKSFCRRNGLTGVCADNRKPSGDALYCRYCGKEVRQTAGRKEKKFCSDACRMAWWNSHPDRINRKAIYSFECTYCKKPFTAYGNSHRKYCSHKCYLADRFGGGFID